jgi:putative CocE/NonD family hydrolase
MFLLANKDKSRLKPKTRNMTSEVIDFPFVGDVRRRHNLIIRNRDSVGLATDLYFPEGDGPFPTVLGRTPYNKNLPAYQKLTSTWNARGYIMAIQDVQGRGDSEGSFHPYVNDRLDGYDTIEWIAAQSWSDGNIVMRGASYGARASWVTALERPPHLRALVVVVSPSDPFVEFPTSGTTPMMISWYRLVDGRVSQSVQGVDWMSVYNHLPLMELDEQAGFISQLWRNAMAHTSRDEYWDPIRYQNHYDQIDLPVMHISGWYDDEQIGTPMNYIGMTQNAPSEEARKNQRLLMGPWGHGVNSTQKLGEVDFGRSALIELEGYVGKWLDSVLGRGTDDVPPVRIFIMGPNEWRDESEWPLARTVFTDYFLHSAGNANSRFGDGFLSTDAPKEDEPSDKFTYDPARPVPFITNPTSSQLGGPDDYSAIEQRGDVLCYSTEPLDEDLEVTGPIKFVFFASSSAVDTDFTGKLIDVHPNGFCQRLCDSAIRARYREGPEKSILMEPGTAYEFELDMWNTSQVFKKGHRIRLEVSSSSFPKYERNLNTGEDIGTGTRMIVAENTIWHDAKHPSRLILPVIP